MIIYALLNTERQGKKAMRHRKGIFLEFQSVVVCFMACDQTRKEMYRAP